MPISKAFFSKRESGSALHKTKKRGHGHGLEKFQARMSVQKFLTSIFLQSKISNCGIADSFASMGVIDSRFGKYVPFRPVSFFRNESKSSFCRIFRRPLENTPVEYAQIVIHQFESGWRFHKTIKAYK